MATADQVRRAVYGAFVRTSHPPGFGDLADATGATRREVDDVVRTLVDQHLLVLTPDGAGIERALPFSAVPTAFEVRAGARRWWANRIWDALALSPLLGLPTIVSTVCPDCEAPLTVRVDPTGGPDQPDLIAHFLLPAARWYDDIRFT